MHATVLSSRHLMKPRVSFWQEVVLPAGKYFAYLFVILAVIQIGMYVMSDTRIPLVDSGITGRISMMLSAETSMQRELSSERVGRGLVKTNY